MSDNALQPVSIAIAALGGQGGGVLAQWIVALAEAKGYQAQYTSVPGVAQRTGATIYYVEMFPPAEQPGAGREPVLALMPAQGDVDICIASELIEGGRAIERGFVTPDTTTLIVSDSRIYAIAEKQALGDGRADAEHIRSAARRHSKHLVMFDMQQVADQNGGVISAVLFGALAGSRALPFALDAYEDAVRASGRAVEINLRSLRQGYDMASAPPGATPATEATRSTGGAAPDWTAEFPAARDIIAQGALRLRDYQDQAYVELYLQRLRQLLEAGADKAVLREAARRLALWMSFEDVIRVADLKTRSERFEEIRREVRAAPGQFWYAADYTHPRYEEFCGTLPARLGAALLHSKVCSALLAPLFSKGRVLETGKLGGFLLFYLLARLRRFRRGTLRYRSENALIESWLARLQDALRVNAELALEVARCPALIKGYGDTRARGLARFHAIMERADAVAAHAARGADELRTLREAALADEEGAAFEAALARRA